MQGNSLVRIQPVFVAGKLYLGRAKSTIQFRPNLKDGPASAGSMLGRPRLTQGLGSTRLALEARPGSRRSFTLMARPSASTPVNV